MLNTIYVHCASNYFYYRNATSDFICMPRSRQMHHDLCFKSQQPFKRAHVDVQIIREGYLYHAFNQSINNSSFNALLESDKAICEYVIAVSSLGSAVNKVSSSGSFNQQKCLMLENIHCILSYCGTVLCIQIFQYSSIFKCLQFLYIIK